MDLSMASAIIPPSRCPDPHTLRAFLLGEVDETELGSVADHLEACSHCLEHLHSLEVEDSLMDMVRDQPEENPVPVPLPVQNLIQELKQLGSQETVAVGTIQITDDT